MDEVDEAQMIVKNTIELINTELKEVIADGYEVVNAMTPVSATDYVYVLKCLIQTLQEAVAEIKSPAILIENSDYIEENR